MTWMRHYKNIEYLLYMSGQRIFIQIFKFLKEYQIAKPVSYLQKCFQLILVQFVTLEAIYTL